MMAPRPLTDAELGAGIATAHADTERRAQAPMLMDAEDAGLGFDHRFQEIHTPIAEREGQKDHGWMLPIVLFCIVAFIAWAVFIATGAECVSCGG